MESFSLILAIVVVTALAFDFTNGFHDTANAMATTISTGALGPRVAVAMSAVLNLVGAFLSVEVAKTLFGGLIGATVVSVGMDGVNGDAVVMKVLIPAVAAPVVAGIATVAATRLTY